MTLAKIQVRRDTDSNWVAVNPVLAPGEMGVDLDVMRAKVGDGVRAWAALPWVTMDPADVQKVLDSADAIAGAVGADDALMTMVAADPNSAFRASLSATFADRMAAAQGKRFLLRAESARWKGGSIGTGGKSVIAFRIDHGATEFFDSYKQMFTDRGLPFTYGVVTDSHDLLMSSGYEPTTVTWEQLRAAHIEDGFEIHAHTRSHRAPYPERPDGYTIHEEIVGSKEIIESHGIRVQGFQGGGVPGLTTPDYSNNFTPDSWDTEAGLLMLSNYALTVMGYKNGGAVRTLPVHGEIHDLDHYTLDGMTLAEALTVLDYLDDGLSLEIMIHPALAPAQWITDLPTLLDAVVAKRDAGIVEVLTVSGMAWADPSHDRHLSITRDGSFERASTLAESAWSSGGSGTLEIRTNGGHTGSNYLHIPAAAGFTYAFQNFTRITSMQLGGQTMMLEAYARAVDAPIELQARLRNPNDDTQFNINNYWAIPDDDQWHPIRYPFTIPVGTTNVQTRIARRSGAGGLDVDDVRVVPV